MRNGNFKLFFPFELEHSIDEISYKVILASKSGVSEEVVLKTLIKNMIEIWFDSFHVIFLPTSLDLIVEILIKFSITQYG